MAVYRPPSRVRPHAGVRTLTWREPGPQAGYPNSSIQGVIYSGGGLSLQTGVSPPVVIGDTFFVSSTSPAGFVVTVNNDGTVNVFAGGNTSRQSFNYLLYRRISGTFDGPGIVWLNEVGPTWGRGVIVPFLAIGTPFSVNLAAAPYATSIEGDALVFTLTTGSLPTGITLTSAGLLSGTPSALGSYNFTITATDITGTGTVSPASFMTIGAIPVLGITDNIRVPRHWRRLRHEGKDWQSLSLKEIEKQKRIDRKLRLKREGREEEAPQVEIHEELAAEIKPEPRRKTDASNLLYALRANKPDDEQVFARLNDEHAKLIALAHQLLRTLQ